MGEVHDKVIRKAIYFLEGKGLLFSEDEHKYFRLFGFEGTTLLLLKFVTDKLFVSELCRQYLYCFPFFEEKRKR
jgi:hypothetical protein